MRGNARNIVPLLITIRAISKKTDRENLEIHESRDNPAKAGNAMRSTPSIRPARQLTRADSRRIRIRRSESIPR